MLGIARDVAALRARVCGWRERNATVGLVPTMGALHDGHLALIRRSLATTSHTCVTLFVNPKQFGPNEDFARYPRDEARDLALIEKTGAHLVFAPSVAKMYPEGHQTRVAVTPLGDTLEGEFRPGFFAGVATVVTKLLLQALPDIAFFGEKDYQQLLVIRRLARDLDIPVEIVGVPTVRESDGLALSSRNAYLSASERKIAPALHRVLVEVARNLAAGQAVKAEEARAARVLRDAGFAKVDYVAVRDAETLAEPGAATKARRVLAAAWLGASREGAPSGATHAGAPGGATRLIDNVAA
jgi:pantoate--beta-alanine ligase